MQADPDSTSDNQPDTNQENNTEYTESDSAPFNRMAFPHPTANNSAELPKAIPHESEWWYDQYAKGKRGKNRRYTGRVKRVHGAVGKKLRADLIAVISDLLEWANEQQAQAGSTTESREDGAAR